MYRCAIDNSSLWEMTTHYITSHSCHCYHLAGEQRPLSEIICTVVNGGRHEMELHHRFVD